MPDLSTADQKRPLLLFEVGVSGAVPRDFGEALGEELGATIFSHAMLKAIIKAERERRGSPKHVQRSAIAMRLFSLAKPVLKDGRDVLADVLFNTVQTRARTPLELARRTGAIAVALNLVTPKAHIHNTIRERIREGELKLAVGRVHPNIAVDDTFRTMQRPTTAEGIDLIIDLDGRVELPELVSQVVERLDAHDLRG